MMLGWDRVRLAFTRDQWGNAAVEFAILAPILLFLIAGTIDLGLGFQEKVKLQSVLNSGLQHVMQTAGAELSVTKAAIEFGLASDSSASVSVDSYCRCSADSTSCKVSCAPGTHRFATASISRPYHTLFFDMDMTLAAHFDVYVGEVE